MIVVLTHAAGRFLLLSFGGVTRIVVYTAYVAHRTPKIKSVTESLTDGLTDGQLDTRSNRVASLQLNVGKP